MLDEHVIFFEAALIEKHGQPLPSRQPPLLMLRSNPGLAAPQLRAPASRLEFVDHGGHARSRLPVAEGFSLRRERRHQQSPSRRAGRGVTSPRTSASSSDEPPPRRRG